MVVAGLQDESWEARRNKRLSSGKQSWLKNIWMKGEEGLVVFAGFGNGIQEEREAQDSWSGMKETGISIVSRELTYTGS